MAKGRLVVAVAVWPLTVIVQVAVPLGTLDTK